MDGERIHNFIFLVKDYFQIQLSTDDADGHGADLGGDVDRFAQAIDRPRGGAASMAALEADRMSISSQKSTDQGRVADQYLFLGLICRMPLPPARPGRQRGVSLAGCQPPSPLVAPRAVHFPPLPNRLNVNHPKANNLIRDIQRIPSAAGHLATSPGRQIDSLVAGRRPRGNQMRRQRWVIQSAVARS